MIVRCWMEGGVPQPCEHFFATHFVFQKSSVSHWKGLALRDRNALREKILCTRRNRSALPSRHHLGQIIHHLCSVDRLLCIDIDLWHVASTNTHCPTELKALRSYNQCRGIWTTCIQNVFCHVHVCSCLPLITALPGNPQSQLVSLSSSLCDSDLQSF